MTVGKLLSLIESRDDQDSVIEVRKVGHSETLRLACTVAWLADKRELMLCTIDKSYDVEATFGDIYYMILREISRGIVKLDDSISIDRDTLIGFSYRDDGSLCYLIGGHES